MGAPIVVIRQPNRTPLHISVRGPLEVGRECDGVLLGDSQVSRRHLRLDVIDEVVWVEDLGSTNGSHLDGALLTAPIALLAGACVALGDSTIELLVEAPTTSTSSSVSGLATQIGSVHRAGPITSPPSQPSRGQQTSIELVANSVMSDGLAEIKSTQGTITIVFSDIEASTARTMEIGDSAWFGVLAKHNDMVRSSLRAHGGTEIKNQGDGFMMSFPGARLALQSMCDIQRQLAQLAEDQPELAVRVRMGMHTGEVLVDDDGDLFGKHVIVAARIANLADGGEILVSSLVKEITSSRGDVVYGAAREVELKGIEGDHVVYPVDWTAPLID